MDESSWERGFAWALGLLLSFGVLAHGARDYWAATVVYLSSLALAATLAFLRSWPEDGPGISTESLLPMALLVAAWGISFRQSVRPQEAFFAWMDWTSSLVLFWTARQALRTERALRSFAAAAAPALWFELAVVLAQHWAAARASGAPLLSMQAPGTLVNASVVAAFFLLWTPVFAGLAWQDRGRPSGRLWTATALAGLLGLLAADSTWSLFCLLAGIPLLAGPQLRGLLGRRPKQCCAAGAVLLAAAAGLLAWKLGHRVTITGQPQEATAGRLLWWRSGLKMFLAHPWLGVGPGNFGDAFMAFKQGSVENTLFAHNLLVTLLCETGLAGTGALALFLGGTYLHLRGTSRQQGRWPFLVGLALFGLFGAAGLTVEFLANLACAAVFLGAAASGSQPRLWKPGRASLLALVGACLCAVPFLVSPLQASRLCVAAQKSLAYGDFGSALQSFAAATELDPRSGDAYRGWARASYARFLASGDAAALTQAVARQQRAVELDRLNPAARQELRLYQAALGSARRTAR